MFIAEWCKQERQKEKEREAQQQKEREEAEEKRAQAKARHKEAVTAFQALLEEKIISSEVSFCDPQGMNALAQRRQVWAPLAELQRGKQCIAARRGGKFPEME